MLSFFFLCCEWVLVCTCFRIVACCVFVFLRFTTCHTVQRKYKFSCFHFCFGVLSQDFRDKFTAHSNATVFKAYSIFFWLGSGAINNSPSLVLFHTCVSSVDSQTLCFLCTREQGLYLLWHCEGCLLKAFDTHRHFSPTYLTTTPTSAACPVSNRQTDSETDRQTGTKRPIQIVDPLWGMATLVRQQ